MVDCPRCGKAIDHERDTTIMFAYPGRPRLYCACCNKWIKVISNE